MNADGFTIPIRATPGSEPLSTCGEGCTQTASFTGTATWTRVP